MLGVVGHETLDMFLPEKIVPVVGFLHVNGDGPGQGYDNGGGNGNGGHAKQVLPATGPDHIRHNGHHRHRKSQKSLGQKRHAAEYAEQRQQTLFPPAPSG